MEETEHYYNKAHEQDEAHSSLSVCPFCGLLPEWVNEYLQDGHFYIRCPHCHIVMKEDRRDKVIGMWNRRTELTRLRSELQQERELRKELVGYVVAYHGLSSLTSDEDIYIRSLIEKAKLNN